MHALLVLLDSEIAAHVGGREMKFVESAWNYDVKRGRWIQIVAIGFVLFLALQYAQPLVAFLRVSHVQLAVAQFVFTMYAPHCVDIAQNGEQYPMNFASLLGVLCQ